MASLFTNKAIAALQDFNNDYSKSWDFGENWNNTNTMFETFVNKYLFPKINETAISNVPLGNRFDFLAKELDFIGQYSEDYVILDSVPINMNLSKSEELMLKRNYPKMATKLYGSGILKKQKFTLNNNDVRLNFSTLGDAVKYAMAVYKKRLSDINVSEEKEIKAMLLDYSLNNVKEVREANTASELIDRVFDTFLNIQNNSEKYNEATEASGGSLARYTTATSFKDIAILTSDEMKARILDSKVATTYNIDGLDLTNRIISFDDLGGVFKLSEDVTIKTKATVDGFRYLNDYQIEVGDIIPKDSVLTFNPNTLPDFIIPATETVPEGYKSVEIKPTSEYFAYVFDINKLRYRRCTKDMLKTPFYNGEFDEVTYWVHYYSFKAMSPFFNSVRVGE